MSFGESSLWNIKNETIKSVMQDLASTEFCQLCNVIGSAESLNSWCLKM